MLMIQKQVQNVFKSCANTTNSCQPDLKSQHNIAKPHAPPPFLKKDMSSFRRTLGHHI